MKMTIGDMLSRHGGFQRSQKHIVGHRRRTHRGNGLFAPVLLKVPGQTYPFAPVLFGQ